MKPPFTRKWLHHNAAADDRPFKSHGEPFRAIICRIKQSILGLGCIAAQMNAWGQQEKIPLLEPQVERDLPIPLYKSLWEILNENRWNLLMVVATILMIGLGWWLYRYSRKSSSSEEAQLSRDPYEEAMEALEELQAESRRMAPKPFMFRLSEVLRSYVERRFELPALEQTGEEFLRETVEHKFFRNHYEELLREFIARSEVVKYSRQSIDGEGLHLLLNSAIHFVKDTHRRLEEEKDLPGPEPAVEAA